jgi:pimeloyl-ACP methyl ester carboxylesterase
LDYLKELIDYWHYKFNWHEQEATLNKFGQFKALVDGVTIHFIHMRGKSANPLPIILTHGWPDSFYRFYKVIPMLTDPERFGGEAEDSFDVIIPSLPGFGFSSRMAMTDRAVADLWAKLMMNLLVIRNLRLPVVTLVVVSQSSLRSSIPMSSLVFT